MIKVRAPPSAVPDECGRRPNEEGTGSQLDQITRLNYCGNVHVSYMPLFQDHSVARLQADHIKWRVNLPLLVTVAASSSESFEIVSHVVYLVSEIFCLTFKRTL